MPINILIADSSVNLPVLKEAIKSEPHLKVVREAKTGLDIMSHVMRQKIDVVVITTFIHDMEINRLIRRIMEKKPVPILIIKGTKDKNNYGDEFKFGIVDTLEVPIKHKKINITSISLNTRIQILAKVNVDKLKPKLSKVLEKNKISKSYYPKSSKSTIKSLIKNHVFGQYNAKNPSKSINPKYRGKIIVIGTSTGGPKLLAKLIPQFPEVFPPVLLVQHMPKGFVKSFADRLDKLSKIHVRMATDGEMINHNTVYIAPGGQHLEITRDNVARIHLTDGPPVNFVKPSVDVTLISATKYFKNKVISIILTGMGADGKNGSLEVKKCGGKVIALNKEDSDVYGMNKSVIDSGAADYIVSRDKIVSTIIQAINEL